MIFYAYTKGMKKSRGRPPKAESDRKVTDLRIPMTVQQKELVTEAARATGQDMANWARLILMDMAKKQVQNSHEAAKPEKKRSRSTPLEYSPF